MGKAAQAKGKPKAAKPAGRPARKAAKGTSKPAKARRAPARKPTRPAARKPAKAAKQSPAAIAKAEKAEGELPVQAYIHSLPGWQRDAARRFDDLVTREVPVVRRAVKWSAAFYGVPDQGWFASVKGFKHVVKFTFFKGTSLKPVPPSGESDAGRSFDLKEGDSFDEARLSTWVRQASKLPGWGS